MNELFIQVSTRDDAIAIGLCRFQRTNLKGC